MYGIYIRIYLLRLINDRLGDGLNLRRWLGHWFSAPVESDVVLDLIQVDSHGVGGASAISGLNDLVELLHNSSLEDADFSIGQSVLGRGNVLGDSLGNITITNKGLDIQHVVGLGSTLGTVSAKCCVSSIHNGRDTVLDALLASCDGGGGVGAELLSDGFVIISCVMGPFVNYWVSSSESPAAHA